MRTCLSLALLCTAYLPALAAELSWLTDYAEARQAAAAADRPLLTVVATDDCSWCARLEHDTLRNREVADLIAARTIALKLHGPSNPRLADGLKVKTFPTLILADADGTIRWRHDGYCKPEVLRRVLAGLSAPKAAQARPPGLPTGLVQEKLSDRPTLWRGVVPHDARELQGADVPDLSARPYLTVTSSDKSRRDQIAAALQASPLGQRYRVLARDPSHWQMEGFKLGQDQSFQASGVALFVQQPPAKPGGFGRLLDAVYDWQGVEALERRIDPNFRPLGPEPAGAGGGHLLLLAAAAGVGLLLLAPRSPPPEPEETDV